MKNYEEMTFSKLYNYYMKNNNILSQDEKYEIEVLLDYKASNDTENEIENKVWSKSLINKFNALYKSICKEYDIENNYGKDFKEELESAIRDAAETHYMYECNLES